MIELILILLYGIAMAYMGISDYYKHSVPLVILIISLLISLTISYSVISFNIFIFEIIAVILCYTVIMYLEKPDTKFIAIADIVVLIEPVFIYLYLFHSIFPFLSYILIPFLIIFVFYKRRIPLISYLAFAYFTTILITFIYIKIF